MFVHGSYAFLSSPGSPFHGDSDFPILSLYQLSIMDVASAVVTPRIFGLEDKVVNIAPRQGCRSYLCFVFVFPFQPIPCMDMLLFKDYFCKCPKSSMHLCMDQPPSYVPAVSYVLAVLKVLVVPIHVPIVPSLPHIDRPPRPRRQRLAIFPMICKGFLCLFPYDVLFDVGLKKTHTNLFSFLACFI